MIGGGADAAGVDVGHSRTCGHHARGGVPVEAAAAVGDGDEDGDAKNEERRTTIFRVQIL